MTAALVVASVPAGHSYVARIAAPGGARRLPDPDPDGPDRPASGRWWPPAMLEPSWVATRDFDLMHLHFGFDDRTPRQLRELVGELRRRDRPLVLTLHDLRSPHQQDPTTLRAQLDVLVPSVDALLTLTQQAADAVARRWGRRPEVVPHPHVVDLDRMREIRGRRSSGLPDGDRPARVGVSAKSLRTNTDVGRLLPGLLGLDPAEVRVVVSIHREVFDRPATSRAARLAAALREAQEADRLELVVHDPFDDEQLWRFVAGLDAAVLPYRFGTHSGWLEMCHDLGTSVVAPDLGCYAAQGADAVFLADETSLDDVSLRRAVRTALARRGDGLPGLDVEARTAQRDEVADRHESLYRSLVAARRQGAA